MTGSLFGSEFWNIINLIHHVRCLRARLIIYRMYKNVTFRLLQTIYALTFVRSYGKTQYVEMN